MITDEESWDYYQRLLKAHGFDGITDLLSKYHNLERAVLAKAGEQEPVGYADLSRVNDFDAPRLTAVKFTENQSAVYAHPLPAQAMPDKIGTDSVISSIYKKGWNDCIDVILSSSPKP